MIRLPQEVCRDFDQAKQREWLETNGVGSFACSTIMGMNTRRYHGLLTAATRPPVGRMLLLSKLEETLIVGDSRVDVSTNQYVGAVHPAGFRCLTGFRPRSLPCFHLRVRRRGGGEVRLHGVRQQHTVIKYRLNAAPKNTGVRLEARPLIAFRDYHSTTHEKRVIDGRIQQNAESVCIRMPASRLYLAHNAAARANRWRLVPAILLCDRGERGLDFVEDLFNP